jgi:hypothetical protein
MYQDDGLLCRSDMAMIHLFIDRRDGQQRFARQQYTGGQDR